MGNRLDGPVIQHKKGADIVSDGTSRGAVQVPGSGKPIVLLADCGTTGGYSKIATVISTDLPRMAQAQPGDTVVFRAVSLEEAHQALREQEAFIASTRG
jgi:allophanate hydrolase subunit 2